MIHVQQLDGCAPAPLAHYLKALGILRLVAEQADSDARGWWDGDHFRLATKLTREELEDFFLRDYQPTPLVSPWNKGGGFFAERDSGISPIDPVEESQGHRFSALRCGIRASRLQIEELSKANKKVRGTKSEAKKRTKAKSGIKRCRTDFEEDYRELIRKRDTAREDKDRLPILESRALEKADKRLKAAQTLVENADEYKELLDARDAAEKEIREAADSDSSDANDQKLKSILSRLKNSENYKRRLNEADRRFKRLKAVLIPNIRLNWRGSHREWMDAAMVLKDDGTPKYPALLGTGGNDGRLDFTNNFMKRIGEVFDLDSKDGKPQPAALAWVHGSLWSMCVPGGLSGQPVGQYFPGTAGGANNGNGPESDSLVNPVDFILMLEGVLAFTSSASRRFGSSQSSRAASPFALNASGAAYASSSAEDKSARGEQWMPLWSRPSSYRELRQLFAEGRAQIGRRIASEPLDLARAVRRLGTARGIKAFQRYGYIQRNGQSNLAVPLGRFDVADRPSEHLACIDDLDLWLRRLRREARRKNAPTRLAGVEKRLVDALFYVTEHPGNPGSWQNVFFQLIRAEEILANGTGFAAGPVPSLRPQWIAASYDGTVEFRLALAFALQARGFRPVSSMPVDPIRRHWLPLDRKKPWHFATSGTGETKLDVQPDVVMHGRRGLDDAIALVERRLVEASADELRHLPLKAVPRASAGVADLTNLLAGNVDLDRTLTLARAFMALNRKTWARKYVPFEQPRTADWPDDAWLAIRLCTLPWPLETRSGFKLDIGADPAIIRRLAGGDGASAIALALRRLSAAGVRCTVRAGTAPPDTARLWAAALAFPITQRTARQFLYRLDPNTKE